jgi:hypothetical protein
VVTENSGVVDRHTPALSLGSRTGDGRSGESTGTGSTATGLGSGSARISNPFFLDGTVYASWYTDGLRVIDVSDPTIP